MSDTLLLACGDIEMLSDRVDCIRQFNTVVGVHESEEQLKKTHETENKVIEYYTPPSTTTMVVIVAVVVGAIAAAYMIRKYD